MEYFSNITTLIILLIGALIAYLQYRLYKFQIKKELYERRLPIYKNVTEYIAKIITYGTAKQDDYFSLIRNTADCEFLFGPEIKKYVDELYSHGVKLNSYSKMMDRLIKDESLDLEYKKYCDKKAEVFEWFSLQFDIAKNKFRRYLQISKPLA